MTKKEKDLSGDLVDLARNLNRHRLLKEEITYTTWYNRDRSITRFEDFIKERTGSSIIGIGALSVNMFSNYISSSCSGIANSKALNATLLPILHAIEYSAFKGVIDHDHAIKYFDVAKEECDKLGKEEPNPEYLREDQIDKLVARWRNAGPGNEKDSLDIFFFSLHADGIGFSDIMTLEWKDVDLTNKAIHLESSSRDIPLDKFSEAILNRWKAYGRNDRFVFNLLDPRFKTFMANQLQEIQSSKNKILNNNLAISSRAAGIIGKASFQMARHTFVAQMLKDGIPVEEISKRLGHCSVSATKKTYKTMIKELVPENENTCRMRR